MQPGEMVAAVRVCASASKPTLSVMSEKVSPTQQSQSRDAALVCVSTILFAANYASTHHLQRCSTSTRDYI